MDVPKDPTDYRKMAEELRQAAKRCSGSVNRETLLFFAADLDIFADGAKKRRKKLRFGSSAVC